MSNYQIYEMPLLKKDETVEDALKRVRDKKDSPRILILRGGLGEDNPKIYMDKVVNQLTKNIPHNDFIERTLDNPYVRVIIIGINELPYDNK